MKQKVLAVNSGSSSLKFQLFLMPEETVMTKGIFERIGNNKAIFTIEANSTSQTHELAIDTHQQAVDCLLTALVNLNIVENLEEIHAVGHRVAHGGEFFNDSIEISDDVEQKIEQLSALAPLHNPINLVGIRAFKSALPKARSVAVFDTSFHQTMEPESYIYPIPYRYYTKYGVRRYGFHGTSHKYVAHKYADLIHSPIEQLKLIICHLGNGASITAVKHGKSISTSMGFTPLAGLMMGTRCGDIDPSILPFLADTENMSTMQLNEMINKESGLLGVSELSSDCRDIEKAASLGHSQAKLALDIFTKRIRSFIGEYLVDLDGADAIIFTGGIGENSRTVRKNVCANLVNLGIQLDPTLNRANETVISSTESSTRIAVINTNEELMIAQDLMRVTQ